MENKELEDTPPLRLDYFDDNISLFQKNIDLNEDLYNELHSQYSQNQSVGFSLGTSRGSIELTKVLAQLRGNGITAASQYFNAKKSIAELELKKQTVKQENNNIENNKDFVRATLEAIHTNTTNIKKESSLTVSSNNSIEPKVVISTKGREELDKTLESKLQSGEITLSNNEKAMKYDFEGSVEPVLDAKTGNIVVVEKGTTKIVKDYPLSRINVGEVVRTEGRVAYTNDNKQLKIINK